MENNKLQVAVLTGGHPYDTPFFYKMFRSIPDIDYYVHAVEEFCTDMGKNAEMYDVVMFYNMTLPTPQDEQAWNVAYKKALEDIAERGQGIFVLHHATLAFPDWDVWTEVTGLRRKEFDYRFDQKVKLHVEDPSHPITKGIVDWEMIDETYLLEGAGEDSNILITTDNPTSMKSIAWTRNCRKSRVFCLQSGHDRQTYGNDTFRELILRGSLWTCGRL